jgi:hypothetical protein
MRARMIAVVGLLLVLGGCGSQSRARLADPNAIKMRPTTFSTSTRTIPMGGRLTFASDGSHALHILVIGRRAEARTERGAPEFGGAAGHRSDVGEVWRTPPWNAVGTFHVTCTIHPAMNLTVRVTD